MDLAVAAERALIGALLSDRDAIADVVERLSAEAFADEQCRMFYQAIRQCWDQRIPPDPITVSAVLLTFGYARWEQDWVAAMDMMAACPFGVHARYYADIVIGQARRRAVATAATTLATRAVAGDANLDDLLAEVRHSAESFGAIADTGPERYEDAVPAWRAALIEAWEGRTPRTETHTGFSSLDRLFAGGFRPGELVIIGARPGVGKSSMALQLAHNAARHHRDRQVLIFSSEMSLEMLLVRAASEITGLSYLAVRQQGLDSRLRDRVLDATGFMETLPVAIDDESAVTTAQMQVRIERALRQQPVSLVLFDYLELAGDDVRGDNEERRVGTIVRRLKHVARVTNVPVVVLSQLNREVERRPGGAKPRLADLRYSGAIEQNADVVILIHRPAVEGNDARTEAELIIAKHRNGPQKTVPVRFNADTMTFEEYGESSIPGVSGGGAL